MSVIKLLCASNHLLGCPFSLLWQCLQCLYMYNLDKDELICKSCPVYGTEPGELLWPSLSLHMTVCCLRAFLHLPGG